jgi:predicted ATPase with chaperone activity
MNPRRCGRFGELGSACKRGRACDVEYQSRLSAPSSTESI